MHCCSVHPAHLHAPGASLQTPPSDESPDDGAAGTGDSSVSMGAGASADGVIVSAGWACCSTSCVSSGMSAASDDEDEIEGEGAELADVLTGMTMASHCVLDEKAPFLLWLLSTTSRLVEDELATQDDELDQGAAEVAGFSSSCSFSVDEGLGSGVHDDEEVVGAMYSDDDEEDGAGVSSSLPLLSTGSPFRFQICLLVISPARRDDRDFSFRAGTA